MDLGGACCGLDGLVGCMHVAIPDVGAHVRVKQGWLLRHDADGLAQTLLLHVAQVLAIDQDAAACHVIEAVEQPEHRRLARATLAHERDALVGVDLERHASERHVLVVVVRKVHVLELDLAVGHLQLRRPGRIADVDVLVQQLHQLVGIDQILVHDTIECAEHVERRIHLLQVRHKHDKLRRRRAAGHDGPRHGQHREERAEGQDQILHQVEHMEAEHDLVRGLLVLAKRGGEALRLERFVAVALDRLIVEEHVRRDRAARRVAAIHLAAQLGPPRRHAHTQVRVHAHDGEQDEPDHGAKRHRQVHNRDHDIDKHGRQREEQVLEKVVERRAAVERADQLARLAARVVRHGQVQDAVEHEAAHVHVRVPRDRVPQ